MKKIKLKLHFIPFQIIYHQTNKNKIEELREELIETYKDLPFHECKFYDQNIELLDEIKMEMNIYLRIKDFEIKLQSDEWLLIYTFKINNLYYPQDLITNLKNLHDQQHFFYENSDLEYFPSQGIDFQLLYKNELLDDTELIINQIEKNDNNINIIITTI